MPLASNPFLQTTPVVKPQPTVAVNLPKPVEASKANAASFANVFAKQADPKPVAAHEAPEKPAKAKTLATNDKQTAQAKPAASKPDVADSGKSLPADKAGKKTDVADSSKDDDDDSDSDSDDKVTDAQVIDPAPVVPADDPLSVAALAPPVPDPAQPVAAAVAPPTPAPEIPAAMVAALVAPPVIPADPKAFDPASDPLAGLAAVQVALQQNGKGAATTTGMTTSTDASASASSDKNSSTNQSDLDPTQNIANNLAVPVDQPAAGGGNASSGDKAFKSLIEDGLKDTKSAASDTRIDDFANRLAALSQAVQPKVAAPVAVAAPSALPVAMNQSGWSEAVVDRVMYLSSQNLKSADIQLDPAELGRLNIRVNMAPDQQTQITFMSAHVGVREALEGQMSKLRDSFSQQGLGQVDVTVSDQSRGSQQQAQNQQQANQGQGSGRASGSGADLVDGHSDASISEVAAVSQPMTVIGSSQVDFYA